ncbi:MAG: hypothetical protein IPH35_15650 [Rhodoferax sp.]|nr:hypothetical protein [Rhodoferax sp.]
MKLEDRIATLDDAAAMALVQRFARAQPKTEAPDVLDESTRDQLRAALGLDAESAAAASGGEVARAVLLVLASEAEQRAGMEFLLDSPATERFAAAETALLVSAVLVALQTHVRFERDKEGKWTLKIEKKPTDTRLLKDLIKKLISWN